MSRSTREKLEREMLPFAYVATSTNKLNYRCLNCKGTAEFRCYPIEHSDIVTWLCGDCIMRLRERISAFTREQGIDVDLSDSL